MRVFGDEIDEKKGFTRTAAFDEDVKQVVHLLAGCTQTLEETFT